MHTGHISVTVDSFDRIELSANVQRRPGGANSFLSLGNDSQRFTNESFVCIELEEQRVGPLTPISARIVWKDKCHSDRDRQKKEPPSRTAPRLITTILPHPERTSRFYPNETAGSRASTPKLTIFNELARRFERRADSDSAGARPAAHSLDPRE